MTLKPLRSKGSQARVSSSTSLKAPVGGWYVGTNITDAPPGTALILDNCFPQYNYIRMRRGATSYATGMGSFPVYGLMPYVSGTLQKLFAVCNGAIYDVSNTGAVGVAVVSGLTNSQILWSPVTVTGGQYLVVTTGSDAPREYDGTSWTTPSITGVTGGGVNSLYGQFVHKSRLYFLQNQTLNVWYLPVDSIAGAATVFSLAGVVKRGGSLIAGYSWAISSNSGLYETAVFITDQGDVAIYDGDYPGAANWTLKGTYQIPKPLGRQCIMKAGGDVAVMTEDGIIALSTIMTLDQLALANEAVTKAIAPAWRDAVISRTSQTWGWSITSWPLESMVIVNMPQVANIANTQFVANARSGAWARYTGWDARSFAVFGNSLYYGTSDGRVFLAETGGQDDTTPYTAIIVWSYSTLGQPGRRKHINMIRPIVASSQTISPAYSILVDYSTDTGNPPSAVVANQTGFQWDTAGHGWDQDVWSASAGGALLTYASWKSVNGIGTNIAPAMQVSIAGTGTPDIRITQVDLLYELGEVMG